MTKPGLARALAAALALCGAADAPWAAPAAARRSTNPLALEAERVVLANGLVVLLAPDPTVSSVAVWLTFRAGAQFAPPDRGGLAHLVEHVMATGPTPDTDYVALLERRGARGFNATTSFDAMSFEAVVPPEELATALWVAADRLVALPPLVDDALVERHRRVILQERALVRADVPYGLVDEHVFRRLYAEPSPLHGGTYGTPATLRAATAQDVRAFARDLLVPANGVLAVVGRFDPAVARRLVEDGLGRLPAGRRAPDPVLPPMPALRVREAMDERLSHDPRVTLAWRLPNLPHDQARALQLGGRILTFLTDGAFGMDLSAGLLEYQGEALFTLQLAVPYDEEPRAVRDDATGFLRNLTRAEIPVDFFRAAGLALDRGAMFQLDGVATRAQLLSRVELVTGPSGTVAAWLDRRDVTARVVKEAAAAHLAGSPTVEIHARPTVARPPPLPTSPASAAGPEGSAR